MLNGKHSFTVGIREVALTVLFGETMDLTGLADEREPKNWSTRLLKPRCPEPS